MTVCCPSLLLMDSLVVLVRPEGRIQGAVFAGVVRTLTAVPLQLATLTCTIVTVVFALRTLGFFDSVNGVVDGQQQRASAPCLPDAFCSLGKKTVSCSDPLSDESFNVLGGKFRDLSMKNCVQQSSLLCCADRCCTCMQTSTRRAPASR
jgi:hypothetical protein